MKQPPDELVSIAEDSWKHVHHLFMFDDEWHLDKGVDDICVYSRHSSSLGKIFKLEVSYIFVLTVSVCPAHCRCMIVCYINSQFNHIKLLIMLGFISL